MLDWKKVDGSWLGNGFRIHRVGPREWALEERSGDGASVTVEPETIAALPTLAAAKHKAETLHTRERVGMIRQRLALIGFGGWALAVVVGNPVLFIAAGVIASAALLELLTSYLEGLGGGARELTQ